MKQAGSASPFVHFAERSDVIDVRMRMDQMLRANAQRIEASENAFRLGTAVDDDRLAGGRIGNDRAGAGEGAEREMLDDYGIRHAKSL